MVKSGILLMTIPLLIAACASAGPQLIPTPIEVKVPVPSPIYCSVPKLARPALPISGLKADSPPADTVRAYAASVAILKGAVKERDVALAGCAAPATDQTPAAPSSGESASAIGDSK